MILGSIWESVTLFYMDYITSHFFPENFIEIPEVAQKIRKFSPSIITIFIDFSKFLTFPCYKETNDISI